EGCAYRCRGEERQRPATWARPVTHRGAAQDGDACAPWARPRECARRSSGPNRAPRGAYEAHDGTVKLASHAVRALTTAVASPYATGSTWTTIRHRGRAGATAMTWVGSSGPARHYRSRSGC